MNIHRNESRDKIRVDFRDAKERVKELGRRRHELSMGENLQSRKVDDGSSEKNVTTRGIKGEFAVGCLLGESLRIAGTPDDGHDFKVNGVTIDVKARGETNGHFGLYTKNPEEFKADVGILVWLLQSGWEALVVGWIDRGYFMENYEITSDTFKGERAALRWQHFRPFWRLEEDALS